MEDKMKCFNCGAELTEGTKFCSYCGVRITEQELEKEEFNPDHQGPIEETLNESEYEDTDEELEYKEIKEDAPFVPPFNRQNGKPASNPKPSIDDKEKSKIHEFWNKLSLFGKLATVSIVASVFLGVIAYLAGRIFSEIIAIVWFAIVVVAILMKKNVIKVPKTWISLLVVILSFILVVPYSGLFKVNMADYEKYAWNEVVLADMLPTPESPYGKIVSNSESYLVLYVNKTIQEQYFQYIEACKKKGFTIDTETVSNFFYAYNEQGYKLSLSYQDYSKEMHISLSAGMELGVLSWSDSDLAQMLPVPESAVGEIRRDDEKGFAAYIGNTSINAFNFYVKACGDKGFTVEADKSDKNFSAKNMDGYRLSIDYRGNNIIYIFLEEPEYKVAIEIECVENLLFSKYDVDVYVDDNFKGTIAHGDTKTFELMLTKGSYVLKFVSDEDDKLDGETEFYIQKDESLKYEISCSRSGVNVDTIVGTSKPNDDENQ